MANWLDKALGRRSATIIRPVPFVRTCPCGTQLSGVRQARARRMICAQCGEPHFIMSVNLYPESERVHFATLELGEFEAPTEYRTPPKTEETPDIDIEAALAGDDSMLVDDEPSSPDFNSLRKLADDDKSVDDSESNDEDYGEDDYDEPRGRKLSRGIALPSPREERAGQRQKLLIVGSAFFVLVAAMAVWVVWDRGQESAEIRLQTARDAGLIALESGDFVTARREFAAALEALQTLGVTGERLDSLRELWLESEAAVGLTNRSLVQLVDSANRTLSEGTPEDWDGEFRAIFRDQWILIDQTPLKSVSAGETGGRRIELLWEIDGLPIQIAGIEPLLAKLQAGGSPERILFAGQLSGCRRETSAWVVELKSENAFLWRRFRSLVQLGFAFDDEEDIRDLIKAQAALPNPTELVVGPQESLDAT